MDTLYKLYEMLERELDKFVDKGDLNSSSLDAVDKITHSMKSVCYLMENDENEGSYDRGSYGDGSYARGRGRNAKRDSRGRYARDGYSRDEYSRNYSRADGARGMIADLEDLMHNAPNDSIKQRAQSLISEIERA